MHKVEAIITTENGMYNKDNNKKVEIIIKWH